MCDCGKNHAEGESCYCPCHALSAPAAEATARPWAIDSELPPNPRSVVARTTGGIPISGNTVGPHDENSDMANARLIVDAVNAYKGPHEGDYNALLQEALSLRADNERLRGALERIVEIEDDLEPLASPEAFYKAMRLARAALKGKGVGNG